jgi:hypothetical protein
MFGFILSIWIFILAIGFVICGIYMTGTGQCPTDLVGKIMELLSRK